GRQRLHGGRREPDGVSFDPRVGDPAEELEELRGPDDRIRHPPASISFSWLTLARMYPLSGMRSAPTTDSATWCPTPAAASAASKFRVEVPKNSITAASAQDGEFDTSTTASAPARAAA